MGWLIYSHIPDNIHDEISRILTGPQTTPLKISKVGSTWYAAVRATPTTPPTDYTLSPDGTYTFAAVILTTTSKKRQEWSYKDLDETMGPHESRCPKSILSMLSPTTSTYANNWRERCRAHRQHPKLTRFRVPKPLNFQSFTAQEFEKVSLPNRRGLYRDLKTGQLVRLSRRHLEGATPL